LRKNTDPVLGSIAKRCVSKDDRKAMTRQKAYRGLFRTAGDADFASALRAATNGRRALGDARFERQIARALGRRAAPLPKGRPPRRKPDRRQLKLL
jgi:hypothetical protein